MPAASLDAVLRAGLRLQAEAPERFEAEATGACVKGFPKTLRTDWFFVQKKNGTRVKVQGAMKTAYTLYTNPDPDSTLAIFDTNYGGLYQREYPALLVNAVKVQYFPPSGRTKEGKFRFIVEAGIKQTPFGEHELASLGQKWKVEHLLVHTETTADEGDAKGRGSEPSWDVGSKQCLKLEAFRSKFGYATNTQWEQLLNTKGSLEVTRKYPELAKKQSYAKKGWEDLLEKLEFFLLNLAIKISANAR